MQSIPTTDPEVYQKLSNYLVEDFEFGNQFASLFQGPNDFCESFTEKELPEKLRIVSRISQGKSGDIWVITDGIERFILKKIKAEKPQFLELEKIAVTNVLKLASIGVIENMVLVGGQEYYLRSGNNNFVNQTIISLALQTILPPRAYAFQTDAFFCDGDGYTFLEYANEGTLYEYLGKVKMTDKNLFTILYRVFKPLAVLKQRQHCFNHNDFKCKNVLVHNNKQGRKEFLLSDFDKSSMFYNNCYFYPYNRLGSSSIFDPFFEKDENGNHVMVYDLQTSVRAVGIPTLQLWTMYGGYPFYRSLDFYTFFFTFLAHPKVHQYFNETPTSKLWQLLSLLWIRREDRANFQRKINEGVENGNGQSLSFILVHFANNSYKFRYEIEPFFDFLQVPFNETNFSSKYSARYHLTQNKQLCIGNCDQSPCDTNAYLKGGYISKAQISTQDNC